MKFKSPSFRKDPVTNRWVIISEARANRPIPDHGHFEDDFDPDAFCPFCGENEAETPPTIRSWRLPGSHQKWDVRVFPNKYPALIIENEPTKAAAGIYDTMAGVGAHEVIVEANDHVTKMTQMSTEHFALVLKAWRERLSDLQNDKRFKSVVIFKNHRRAAGASLAHAHSQLIALPMLSKRQKEEIEGAKRYYDFKGRCLFCDIRDQELEDRDRLVFENSHYVAFVPFAARFPFEIWIMPRNHEPAYEKESETSMTRLAEVIRVTLLKLDRALNDPAYNLFVRTAPYTGEDFSFYHWHIEIIPTLTKMAGFEWATEFFINPTPPEVAAAHLRDIAHE